MVLVSISKRANDFLVAKSKLTGKPKKRIIEEYLLIPFVGFGNDEQ